MIPPLLNCLCYQMHMSSRIIPSLLICVPRTPAYNEAYPMNPLLREELRTLFFVIHVRHYTCICASCHCRQAASDSSMLPLPLSSGRLGIGVFSATHTTHGRNSQWSTSLALCIAITITVIPSVGATAATVLACQRLTDDHAFHLVYRIDRLIGISNSRRWLTIHHRVLDRRLWSGLPGTIHEHVVSKANSWI